MRTTALLVGFLLAAGCADRPAPGVTEETIQNAYLDADLRFSNSTASGEHETTYRIPVPISANSITIKAMYRSNKDGSFVLKNPQGNGAKFDTFPTAKTAHTDAWYRALNPDSGRWAFSAHLTHGGDYAFGVYIES